MTQSQNLECPLCAHPLDRSPEGGRPHGLTAELAAAVVTHIRAGRSAKQAFALQKVPRSTYYRWKANAEAELEPYAATWLAIEAAETDFLGAVEDEVRHGQNVAGGPDPNARIAYLAAKDPTTWGKRVRIERHAEQWSEQMVEAMRRRLSKEAFREFIEALAAEAGVDREGAGEDGAGRPVH